MPNNSLFWLAIIKPFPIFAKNGINITLPLLPKYKFFKDRNIFIFLYSCLLNFISFNWNYMFSQWEEDSIFYLPHVTKIMITTIVAIYTVIRIIWLPLIKRI